METLDSSVLPSGAPASVLVIRAHMKNCLVFSICLVALCAGTASATEPNSSGSATFTEPSTTCFVSRVDGKKQRPFSGNKHTIPAGTHELRLVSNIYGAWGGYAYIRHGFQAGTAYKVACTVNSETNTWTAWLEEIETGEIVARAVHGQ